MSRRPYWACPEYEQHGNAVCAECLRRFGDLCHLLASGSFSRNSSRPFSE